MTGAVQTLAEALIARASVTPVDAGCLPLLGERLAALGFTVERLDAGAVSNLWARRGDAAPLVVLAGHTDVVPPGPLAAWRGEPFAPWVEQGRLHGRGAADMKSSLAAFIVALERLLAEDAPLAGSIGVLLTSDEEGPAECGTRHVMAELAARGVQIDQCIVGEPSSARQLGDTLRHGRRGSLTGRLRVLGRQGHVAYPETVDNPIHRATPVLAELAATRWDEGHGSFPPTSFQLVEIAAGAGATNVVPGALDAVFNLRFSPASTAAGLRERIEAICERHQLTYAIDWTLSAEPFHTPPGRLTEAVSAAVAEVTGQRPALSTGGGTSDGRFIAPTGAEVVELGPVNASIHQVNEWVALDALEPLAEIYRSALRRLLQPA